MSLYLGTTEITNIDNLVPQSGLDITDLWFGSTKIYTVWQVYEGTIPATINANGSDMRQYQVWGNVGGVGDRTVQLFDKDTTLDGYEIVNNGTQRNKNWCVSDFIPVESDTLYKSRNSGGAVLSYTDKSSQPTRLSEALNANGVRTLSETKFIRMNCQIWQKASCIVAKSEDLPETFVPFGYEVDMTSKTRNSLPSAAEQTITLNGVTATCDGKGKYSFTGTASAPVTITFTLPYDYTIPISKGGGGNGTFSMFNTKSWSGSTSNSLGLLYNTTLIDTWNFTTVNRNAISYVAMAGKTINALRFNFLANTNTNFSCSPMFTDDSYGLPNVYEPYFNITTPIYIGDDPLEKVGNYADYVDYQAQKVVRVIKKYVLTGNENWEEITGAYASRKYFRWIFAPINYCIRHVCVSSHFTQVAITTSTTTVGFDVFDLTSVNGEVLAIRPSGVQSTTLEDFKAWLAEQYAAGTPVTVWCALTVAEEADPPVPLPALPTCEGETVIEYTGQSVALEKVLLKYRKEGF